MNSQTGSTSSGTISLGGKPVLVVNQRVCEGRRASGRCRLRTADPAILEMLMSRAVGSLDASTGQTQETWCLKLDSGETIEITIPQLSSDHSTASWLEFTEPEPGPDGLVYWKESPVFEVNGVRWDDNRLSADCRLLIDDRKFIRALENPSRDQAAEKMYYGHSWRLVLEAGDIFKITRVRVWKRRTVVTFNLLGELGSS